MTAGGVSGEIKSVRMAAGWAPPGDRGREAYDPGAKVTLTFTADAGFKFSRWFNFEGTIKETAPKLTVTMDRPMWIIGESTQGEAAPASPSL